MTPILFLGDSPELLTGLARIGRDLATLLSSDPYFRVGYLGRAGYGARSFPFVQYHFPESAQWGEEYIARVWEDFSGGEEGVIMTVWDPTRLFWFACPQYMREGSHLRNFLESGRFQRWGYFAVDSTGIGNRLTTLARETVKAYDRPLAYTLWGQDIISRSIEREVDWAPHGINPKLFQPRDRKAARMAMGLKKDRAPVIGCVMTNHPRKDWGLAFAILSELKKKYPNVLMWGHADVAERSHGWNIPALVVDFGLQGHIHFTEFMDDESMSYHYSACDAFILPSLGEGFGYPLVEAMACGTPVVHGTYGGGAELVPNRDWLVEPVALRLEGIHNNLRPVYQPKDWAGAVEGVLDEKVDIEMCQSAVDHLLWTNLWPVWRKWFRAGLNMGEVPIPSPPQPVPTQESDKVPSPPGEPEPALPDGPEGTSPSKKQ